MSQVVNAVTSSSKTQRAYRKGSPMSDSERQQAAVARKRSTHKEVKIFVRNSLKHRLVEMCEADGVTQAEMIEKWIELECQSRSISL
ncbi:replication regulatory protein RepA [Serratia entomophila]|uniref:replication regulatory protein RepA n=1 Tax=Serratia entomophila TaxID=42906 RepID=UPI001F4BCE58|nr:replication regulatory protein RepA [Serratia entomophila]ULG11559.1 replication protein RepA [Serratia entomophila]CAI1174350.1 replication protein [Serratia entomophila]CAI1189924.1 replication protein [Serratia entomophila]CAI1978533.1 replication protein [Serratia entomophila]CAI1986670.1 replication protein [Serratia entomophila]